ncbi:type II secretion system F family protein [Tautonia sociabilis]|uniref:Type II secretion system protein GspF domain-containing protein n=1 Tax=Tautonia sociabilis TaxID=2080755 RepID=A0A432MKY9_9BACT|nr:type II secretion system F family protein [Tautonia sociabilis]RUL88072.1 hypothetical protein TsocGM_09015 [Tautonia sociabilis]
MSQSTETDDDRNDGPPSGPSSSYGPPRPLPSARSFGLAHAMIAIAVLAVVGRVAMVAGPAFALIVFVVLVLSAIAGGLALLIRGGSVRSDPMLWIVANAVERGLPLEAGIDACGALCGGSMRPKARAVVRLLQRGTPTAEAFARVPGSFPKAGLVFLRMDWDGPRLGKALRDLIQRRAEWRPFRSSLAMRLVYIGWTLVVMQAVLGFLLYSIAPRYEAIFADFGVPMPRISQLAYFRGNAAILGVFFPLAFLLELVGLPLLLLAFFDPIEWGIGPIDRLLIKRHGATVLRALSGEVAMGRPLPEALDRIGRAASSGAVRRRVRKARGRVDRGEAWTRALASVRLIRWADALALDASQRAGNLSWALGDLADGLDRRAGHRLIVWSQFLLPVAVILLAMPVVVVAVGFFLPLVTLIEAMSR